MTSSISASVAAAALAAIIGGASATSAQQATPPPPPCEAEEFSQFDFWVGDWEVYTTVNGERTLAGTNLIEKTQGGCLIMEHWTGGGGGTGTSMNYYDPVTDQWRQLWVSANGASIDYTGGLNDDGQMVLEGKINYYRNGASAEFRGTWTSNPDGSVRQFFEQFDPEKGEWQTWFDGHYVRKAASE